MRFFYSLQVVMLVDGHYLGYDAAVNRGQTISEPMLYSMPLVDMPFDFLGGYSLDMLSSYGDPTLSFTAGLIKGGIYTGAGLIVGSVVVFTLPESIATVVVWGAGTVGSAALGWETGQLINGTSITYQHGVKLEELQCAERAELAGVLIWGWGSLGLAKTSKWYNKGSENDIYWQKLSPQDKGYYETGQMAFRNPEVYAKFSTYSDPVQRGKAIVEQLTWVERIILRDWTLGIMSNTLIEGPTPAFRFLFPPSSTIGPQITVYEENN